MRRPARAAGAPSAAAAPLRVSPPARARQWEPAGAGAGTAGQGRGRPGRGFHDRWPREMDPKPERGRRPQAESSLTRHRGRTCQARAAHGRRRGVAGNTPTLVHSPVGPGLSLSISRPRAERALLSLSQAVPASAAVILRQSALAVQEQAREDRRPLPSIERGSGAARPGASAAAAGEVECCSAPNAPSTSEPRRCPVFQHPKEYPCSISPHSPLSGQGPLS